jgi:hypothetical protein
LQTQKEGRVVQLLGEAKKLAKEYYMLTGRPLGVTGEVAEFEAIRLLGLRPAVVRQPGFDAISGSGRTAQQLQIKGRCIIDKVKRGAKLGKIDVTKPCTAVLLVLLDSDYNATAILRAEWDAVCAALSAPGSKARNKRGQLSVAKFKQISKPIWRKETGQIPSAGPANTR